MRSLFKISLAVLALGILVVAGSVQAQDSGMQKPTLQITGIFEAGFGQVNYDKFMWTTGSGTSQINWTDKAYSEWVTSYEHRIRFIYGTDDLTAKLVLRPRGQSGGSTNACNATGGAARGLATQDAGQGTCAGTNSSGTGQANESLAGSNAAGNYGSTAIGPGATAGSAFLADIYGTLAWKPMKALAIEFGRFEGVAALDPIAGSYFMNNPIFSGADYWMNWTNIDGITATYDIGILQAGLGISSRCQPRCSTANYNLVVQSNGSGDSSCATGLVAVGTSGVSSNCLVNPLDPTKYLAQNTAIIDFVGVNNAQANGVSGVISATWENTQTIVPYVNGKVGDIGFRAQLPMTSGDIKYIPNQTGGPSVGPFSAATTTRSQSGSGYDVGVSFSGVPGMVVAADVQNFVVTKDSTLCIAISNATGSNGRFNNTCKDWQRDAIVAKFEFQGFQLGYFDQTTDDGKGRANSKQEDTYIKLHYMFPIGPGVIGPEFTQATLAKRQLTGVDTSTLKNDKAIDGTYKDITDSVIRLVGRIVF